MGKLRFRNIVLAQDSCGMAEHGFTLMFGSLCSFYTENIDFFTYFSW